VTITLHHTDCLAWLASYEGPLFDSCVTDPPYHLTSIVKRFGKAGSAEAKVGATGAYARASKGFMGKEWDGGDIAFRPETWRAVFDVLKPGAHLVAFSGTRTYHRMACAIEDAGFEIRDQLAWCYGSGFPKSHDVSKGIDKAAGVEFEARPASGVGFMGPEGPGGYNVTKNQLSRTGDTTPEAAQWQGWGTALKPAWEPICLARKPIAESNIAANVLAHGTGAINVDGCRVGDEVRHAAFTSLAPCHGNRLGDAETAAARRGTQGDAKEYVGRWPANILHDGSEEVLAGFPDSVDGAAGARTGKNGVGNWGYKAQDVWGGYGGEGSAARFFYSAKAGPLDRMGSKHATVKPVDLMRWLARLITPPGGHVLEPFAGSGTTGIACLAEGFDCTMLELEAEHVADIERKLAILRGEGRLLIEEHKRGRLDEISPCGPLFGAAA